MPSSTPKQKRTMAAAAHDPAFAAKVGIPQSVARKFNRADQGLPEYRSGGRIDVTKNPFASGGPMLPRSGHDSHKP